MKKGIIVVLLSFIAACGGGTGSSSSEGYKLKPGSINKFSMKTSFDVNGTTGEYAVIFRGYESEEKYVGVAIDNNAGFKHQFWFPADSIPSTPYTGPGKLNGSDTTLTGINFSAPDPDNIITITGGSVGGITITEIKAYYYTLY